MVLMNLTPQQIQQQQQQRGFLFLFLILFFMFTSHQPHHLQHRNTSANNSAGGLVQTARQRRIDSMNENEIDMEIKKERIKDQIIIDLSKSNEYLEIENTQLKSATIALLKILSTDGTTAEAENEKDKHRKYDIAKLKEEFNLTKIIGSVGPNTNTKNKNTNALDTVMLELPGRTIDDNSIGDDDDRKILAAKPVVGERNSNNININSERSKVDSKDDLLMNKHPRRAAAGGGGI